MPARSAQPLPHRQEAFARHVASGRSLTEAARLAGYAWDSARQTGSRLMKEPHIAARVADLTHANENQRQGELDELVVRPQAPDDRQHGAARTTSPPSAPST